MYWFYIILAIIVPYILVLGYIRIKFKFWSKQPVFHIYNLWYWLFPCGIIHPQLPLKNKYCNFKDINMLTDETMTEATYTDFVQLVHQFYLKEKETEYRPNMTHILPYFKGHNDPCYFLFYNDIQSNIDLSKILNKEDQNKDQNKPKTPIGVITGRPLNVQINKSKLRVYYVDYLCVDKKQRKKGIAPQLIQTYEYMQRHDNKNIVINLFKREMSLTLIIPLVIYYTMSFNITHWRSPLPMHSSFTVVRITSENLSYLYDFMQNHLSRFKCTIYPDFTNISELIKSENVYIYILLHHMEVKAAYFFRNSVTYYENNAMVDCIGSIIDYHNCPIDLFICGFRHALQNLQICID
jgi:hypothetical protein